MWNQLSVILEFKIYWSSKFILSTINNPQCEAIK